jgi:outer membrane receptor for ferrienterochelin and colicins
MTGLLQGRPAAAATLALAAVAGLGATASAAAQSTEDELALAYGDKSIVNIATGSPQLLRRAPSVATVITAEDIKAQGATDLDEVLETVPGLHVSRSPIAYTPVYTIRGIRGTLTNPQVLMLVNGIPITGAYTGDRFHVWAGMPLENIARIEVIRGPGSALYGADAYAGVINILTKTSADISGTETGARVGSFNTADAWMLHGDRWGDADIAAYLRVGSSEGSRRIIDADAQTGLDAIFVPLGAAPASRAPGPVNVGYRAVDGSLDIALEQWRFRAGYKHRGHVGTGAGVAQALDPSRRNASSRISADLTWHAPSFAQDWDVSVQGSYMRYHERSDLFLFPAGTNLGQGVFTDGMIGTPYKWERHGRLNASAFYTGFAQHRIRLGAGIQVEDLYKIRETKNFNPDFSPIGTGSLADVTDVSATIPFIQPRSRTVRYVYAQDEWQLSRDWTLTAGVRHDNYSDVGGTTNPRLALVWEAAYNVTAKLLYGSAFRAPAFTELYAINNPVTIGNPGLQPERMRTWEAALSWQPTPAMHWGMNVFRYRLRNVIRLDSAFTYQNVGRQTGSGLELEASWDATKALQLAGSYGLQRSTDLASGQDAGLSPRHHANLRANWRFRPGWHANTQVNWVAGRHREPGDTRPPVADYTTVDLTLRTERIAGHWEFAVSMRNIFDADAREPSPSGTPFVPVPNDFPLPGRSLFLEARYQF